VAKIHAQRKAGFCFLDGYAAALSRADRHSDVTEHVDRGMNMQVSEEHALIIPHGKTSMTLRSTRPISR
jgi:hypothetical protein